MSDDDARDDWGFSAADHTELQMLFQRHAARIPELMHAIVIGDDGVAPSGDDPGMMGFLGSCVSCHPDSNVRVFPRGGFWWALLERLRALDHKDDSTDLPF
jgi:hypothetical protein